MPLGEGLRLGVLSLLLMFDGLLSLDLEQAGLGQKSSPTRDGLILSMAGFSLAKVVGEEAFPLFLLGFMGLLVTVASNKRERERLLLGLSSLFTA